MTDFLLSHVLPVALGALGGVAGTWLALRGKAPPDGSRLR